MTPTKKTSQPTELTVRNKPRIAIVYDMIYPFHIGGAEWRNYKLATMLAKSGFDVHLVGVKLWNGPDSIERGGVTIHGICNYHQLYGFGGKRSITEGLRFALAVYKFFREYTGRPFDIIDSASFIFLHNYALKLALRNSGQDPGKLLITWHQYFGSYWFSYTNPIVATLAYIAERANLYLAKHHITVAQHTKEQLIARGLDSRSVSVVENGTDIDFSSTEKTRRHAAARNAASANSSNDPSAHAGQNVDVLFVGRLQFQKNVPLLINALAILCHDPRFCKLHKQLRCRIIGEGPEEARLRKLITRKGLDAHVEIHAPVEDRLVLHKYYQQAKIFALPSLLEGFAIVAVEAMAHGLPVVTVDNEYNQSSQILGSAGTYTANNPEEFAAALHLLLVDKKRYEQMQLRAKARASLFTWDRSCNKLLKVYREIY